LHTEEGDRKIRKYYKEFIFVKTTKWICSTQANINGKVLQFHELQIRSFNIQEKMNKLREEKEQ
jgi:hypothetical protein